jgi:hypothetical protein
MFTKDIPLEQAVLDLLDNSIDGAKRAPTAGPLPYEGREVEIAFDASEFRIWDNCGGFDKKTARDYAFRFGRPEGKKLTPNSIGQFGVGMKRALFKFGRHFAVHSSTSSEAWAIDVDVDAWEEDEDDWTFAWKPFAPRAGLSNSRPGTEIWVDKLKPEVSRAFQTTTFLNLIKGLIKTRHRQFLAQGLSIKVNGESVFPVTIALYSAPTLKPAVKFLTDKQPKHRDVRISLIVGIGPSSPSLAGWYVICNGRVILDADRRDVTGWGVVEELGERKIVIPGYHNQFARFRGVVTFDSQDSGRVPWNTTKTDVDQDNLVWRGTRETMIGVMRPVIDFCNLLDQDIEEYTRQRSPLYQFVEGSPTVPFESFRRQQDFTAPARGDLPEVIRYIKIQYARKWDDVEFLRERLGASSAKGVGEKTFDQTLARLKAK